MMIPRVLAAVDPAVLLAACEKVTSAIVADDAAGTVTMQPGHLLGALPGHPGQQLGLDPVQGLGRRQGRLGWRLRHLAELLRQVGRSS